MDIIEIIKAFLLTSAGLTVIIVVGKYFWGLVGEYVKKTENTMDDRLYNVTPKITTEVLEEFNLGNDKLERVLTEILIEHEKIPDDTSKMEKGIKNELDKIQKK